MIDQPDDIQLRFYGGPVERLDGAPADVVVASLNALQRMVYIIGMRTEGRAIGERLKPSAKVRREYTIVCRAPSHGSHIQPFNVASQSGQFTQSANVARTKLLNALRAFDSGDERQVENALPNARERWFMAHAALGLVPTEESGLEVAVRTSNHGPITFKADRARTLLYRYKAESPPDSGEETIVGKLRAIDFAQTIMTIKPSVEPALRLDYPMQFEEWLTRNVRRRIELAGLPTYNQKGDVSSFKELHTATEIESSLEPISEFKVGQLIVRTDRPLSIPVTIDWQDRAFLLKDPSLGIDVFAMNYSELRDCLLAELDVLWRNYAVAPDDDLDAEALKVKHSLLSRFRIVKK